MTGSVLLSIRLVARLAGVSPAAVRAAIRRGRLPAETLARAERTTVRFVELREAARYYGWPPALVNRLEDEMRAGAPEGETVYKMDEAPADGSTAGTRGGSQRETARSATNDLAPSNRQTDPVAEGHARFLLPGGRNSRRTSSDEDDPKARRRGRAEPVVRPRAAVRSDRADPDAGSGAGSLLRERRNSGTISPSQAGGPYVGGDAGLRLPGERNSRTTSPDLDRFRLGFDAQLAGGFEHAAASLTRRRVFGEVRLPGKTTTVIGMRRAGKTTFLHQLRAEKIARGVEPWRLPFLRLEDERLAQLDAISLGALIDEYPSRYLGSADAAVDAWFLDEIQVVPGWERLLRRLLDTGRAELYVSGSSAALLSREIATELRGRGWKVAIFPFSFEEALRRQGTAPPADPRNATDAQATRLESAFREWLYAGGFPEAQGLPTATRIQLLRDYVDVAILRDVIDRHAVRNVAGLRWLARHLLANAASRFSVEKFHARLRAQAIAIGRDTVHDHLAHLEDCFLVRTVWIEADSERQRMVNPRKAYPVDAGLIPAFDRSGRANLGHALETAVLIELERRGCEVTWLRTPRGYEVDFLARSPHGDTELIQVCADASDRGTASRELRALADAEERFPDARRRLLTLTRAGLPSETATGIDALPAWEWFLGVSSPLPEPAPAGWL